MDRIFAFIDEVVLRTEKICGKEGNSGERIQRFFFRLPGFLGKNQTESTPKYGDFSHCLPGLETFFWRKVNSSIIINSQLRCTTFGLKRNSHVNDFLAPDTLLKELKRQNILLIEESLKVFSILTEKILSQKLVVFLAENNGTILEMDGNQEYQDELRSIQLQVGSNWREEKKGTNAIGTCLAEAKPIQVSGEEHFILKFSEISCSAAPILDANNRVVGTVGLATTVNNPFRLTLPLSIMVADSIQTRIQLREQKSQRSGSAVYGFGKSPFYANKNSSRAQLHFNDIYSNCPIMDNALELARKAVSTDENIFITGETGSGKELIAQVIHNAGIRKNEPFLVISSSSIQDDSSGVLMAVQENSFLEKLLEANKGTIYLDEISELTPRSQAMILRLIMEKTVIPYGDTRSIPIDVRIISSSTHPIQRMVKEKTFRSDLYYRLRGIHIDVPNLRERSDLIGIAKFLLKSIDCPEYTISQEAQKKLLSHNWPGNIRELQGVILQAAFLTENGEIEAEHIQLLEPNSGKKSHDKYKLSAKDAEKKAILSALQDANGNISRASEILGLGRTTLYRKFKEYGISL